MKKIVVLLLAAMILLSFCACGKEESSSGKNKGIVYVRTQEAHYDADGICVRRYDYTYDEFAQLLKREYYEIQYTMVFDAILDVYVATYDADSPLELAATELREYNQQGSCTLYEDRDMFFHGGQFTLEWDYKDGSPESCAMMYGQLAGADYYFDYDKAGNIESVYYNVDHEWRRDIVLFEYDKQNRLTREFTRSVDGWGTEKTYFYDGNKLSRIVLRTGFGMEELNSVQWEEILSEKYTWEFAYDSKDRPVKLTCYDAVGQKTERREYTYDENGYPSEMQTTFYMDDEEYREKTVYTCDSNGNIVKILHEDGSYVEYTYEEREVSKEQETWFRRRQGMDYSTAKYASVFFKVNWAVWYYNLIPNPLFDLPYLELFM